MNLSIRSVIIFIGYLIASIPQLADAQDIYFKHLTAEDGLSSNIVRHINKDSRGYLWVCCNNALNRYDGSKFTRYIHNPGDSTSITSGGVSCTLEDYDGSFWISTKNGVCIFDYKTEKFRKIFEVKGEVSFVKSFCLTQKNELFLITTSGLYLFNRELQKFDKFFKNDVDIDASVMTEDNFGNIYLGTWGHGIIVIGKDRKHFFSKIIEGQSDFNSTNSIESLVFDKRGKIWIGTRNGFFSAAVLRDVSESSLKIKQVQDKNGDPLPITFNTIHSLALDDTHKIWIGTENGLNIYDPDNQKLTTLYSKNNLHGGLSNNLILNIYYDPGSGIWIGTYQGGINFYSKGNIPFKDKIPFITQSENKHIQYVKSVYQHPDGKLWVGTDYGLLCLSKNYKLEKTFTHSTIPGSLAIGGVTSIYTDRFNDLWVGTWGGGVCKLDKSTGKFIQYSRLDGENITDSTYTGDCNIIAIKEDSKGFLWIVNKFKVVDRYDRKYSSFRHIDISRQINRPNMEINSADMDKDENLWIGATGAGLIKFDTKAQQAELFAPSQNEKSEQVTNMPSVDVYSVHVNENGKIWIGTGRGLSQFDPRTRKFINYSTENGLNSESVIGVNSDNKGNIWLSTLNGISRLDTITGSFLNYSVDEGVISNAEVAYKGNNGTLFFGGVNGISIFHPDSIWRNTKIPPIVFTDFKLFDKSVLFKNKVLPYHVNEVNEIVLNYSKNSISIDFRALNFIQQNKNVYQCKLDGFDSEWNYLGATNEAKYTNLNSGTYYFKVRAANNSGVWNNTERVLKITILTPWWKTFIFRISAVILIISLVFLIIRIRTIQLVHQKRELKIKVEERTREIEKQQIELRKQAEELIETNSLLVLNQKEIETQKESITKQKNKLEEKNEILEQQKEQILYQKFQTENMANQLHEGDLKKIRFMTNVSHEFRTPLTLIYSPLEQSIREFDTLKKDSLLQRLQLMFRNTKRLLRLINELLDFSKIDAGLLQLNMQKGNLFNFIQNLAESHNYLAKEKGVKFDFQSDIKKAICFFDADKVEKIVSNLLSNAFKFTPNEGRICISLKAGKIDKNHTLETIEISVSDSGIGIGKEFRDKIFNRFFQIESKGKQISGTGIGLALTQELVTLYGGTISVKSELGKGSLFIVVLPCIKNQIDSESEPENEFNTATAEISHLYSSESEGLLFDEIEESGFDSKKDSILVVEDNSDIVQYLQSQFSEQFNFLFAFDGFEGFEKAVMNMPQVILLDIMMPKMNGYELCEKLKKDQRTCHIPVVFLTALADKAEQLKGLEFFADDYISKPFDTEILKAKVNNLIQSRKKLKSLFQTRLSVDSFELVPDSADEKLIRKILLIVDKEISNPNFGVEELSKMIGLSRSHLFRKVREITSQTPVEFIRNLRLDKAAKLLKENKFYVSEVAFMAGFTELTYFRRIFKDFYGVSPSDFAKGIQISSKNIELE